MVALADDREPPKVTPAVVPIFLWEVFVKAGGPTAWAKIHGLDRTLVNKVMHRARPPTESIIRALALHPGSRAADHRRI